MSVLSKRCEAVVNSCFAVTMLFMRDRQLSRLLASGDLLVCFILIEL